MLKFLLILGLILYLVYKIGSFFFRAGAASQQFRNPNENGRVNYDGNDSKTRQKSSFKGGEYIDYEDVTPKK